MMEVSTVIKKLILEKGSRSFLMHDMFQCPEFNSDLSESELSSDDKEPGLLTL